MQKLIKILLMACMMALLISPITASTISHFQDNTANHRLENDDAGLISELDDASERTGIDISVVIEDEAYDDINAAALNRHLSLSYGTGITLYINYNSYDFTIITVGDDINNYFSDEEINYMKIAVSDIFEADQENYAAMGQSFLRNAEFYYYDDNQAMRDPLLVDDADLFNDEEEQYLLELLETASNDNLLDFVIYTTYEDNDQETNMAAADFYDYHHYAECGYMLYINMATRKLFILTTGDEIISGFSDYDLDLAIEDVGSYLSDGDYFMAATVFIDSFAEYYNPNYYPNSGYVPEIERQGYAVDELGIFKEADRIAINSMLEDFSNEYGYSFILRTANDYVDATILEDVLEDTYENSGYFYTGLMIYINNNPENSFVLIYPHGEFDYEFDHDKLNNLALKLEMLFKADLPKDAIEMFMDEVYDAYLYDKPVSQTERYTTEAFFSSIIASVLVTIIVAIVLYRQMRSFGKKRNASAYSTNRGSYFSKANITRSNDIFLYRTTTRSYQPRNTSSGGGSHGGSSSFHGSSGVSHGGRGGSF